VAVTAGEQEAETPARLATLYDLMAALQDVVGPNDALAVTIGYSITGQICTHMFIEPLWQWREFTLVHRCSDPEDPCNTRRLRLEGALS
jgi:hypothetical protein